MCRYHSDVMSHLNSLEMILEMIMLLLLGGQGYYASTRHHWRSSSYIDLMPSTSTKRYWPKQSRCPEIDGLVYLNGEMQHQAGDIIQAKITHADQHDLWAESVFN